jgi:hypothetical protein
MPIALPIPRSILTKLPYQWVIHVTQIANLRGGSERKGIVRKVNSVVNGWTLAEVELTGSSGFGHGGRRLLRDYSILDFELKVKDRGSYTYFFLGNPSKWGLLKNISTLTSFDDLAEDGLATIRISLDDLLARYDGPIFMRPDDLALVVRGSYVGPGLVHPVLI